MSTRPHYFYLSDKIPTETHNPEVYTQLENTTINKTEINDASVLTFFEPLQYELDGFFFKTLVTKNNTETTEGRYRTWDEALKGHDEIVENINRES